MKIDHVNWVIFHDMNNLDSDKDIQPKKVKRGTFSYDSKNKTIQQDPFMHTRANFCQCHFLVDEVVYSIFR